MASYLLLDLQQTRDQPAVLQYNPVRGCGEIFRVKHTDLTGPSTRRPQLGLLKTEQAKAVSNSQSAHCATVYRPAHCPRTSEKNWMEESSGLFLRIFSVISIFLHGCPFFLVTMIESLVP